jgi:hypothetical protein
MTQFRFFDLIEKGNWSNIQFWKIVSLLSKQEKVSFDDLSVHALFDTDPTPILEMERAGLITCIQENGRPYMIKPGRPLFKLAFIKMAEDKKLVSYMGLLTSKKLYKDYTKKLTTLEDELEKLTSVSRSSYLFDSNIDKRKVFLVEAIGIYSKKVQEYWDKTLLHKKDLKLKE